jgi:hypothetical protein
MCSMFYRKTYDNKKSKFIRRSQLKLLTWVLLRRVAKHFETIGLLAESTVIDRN